MRTCVHYYNIVSVEAFLADHILGQMKYVMDFYRLTLTASLWAVSPSINGSPVDKRLVWGLLLVHVRCPRCVKHHKSTHGVNCRAA